MHHIEPALIKDSGATGRQYCILRYFHFAIMATKAKSSVFRHFAIPEKAKGNYFKAKCNYCAATLSASTKA